MAQKESVIIDIRINPGTMEKIDALTRSLEDYHQAKQSVDASIQDLESALTQSPFQLVQTVLNRPEVVAADREGELTA
jgi:hypothetical protein